MGKAREVKMYAERGRLAILGVVLVFALLLTALLASDSASSQTKEKNAPQSPKKRAAW